MVSDQSLESEKRRANLRLAVVLSVVALGLYVLYLYLRLR